MAEIPSTPASKESNEAHQSSGSKPSISAEIMTVGGQAVIEGVMMRSPYAVATAVRKPDGEIEVDAFPFISLTKRSKLLGFPVIRGAVNLGEAMYLGVKTLNWSAAAAVEDGKKTEADSSQLWNKLLSFLSILVAIIFAAGLFMLLPYWGAGIIRDASGSQIAFHAVAGTMRILIFLLYLYAISWLKDMRRIFQYHGAEHKTIFSFEKTGEIEVQSASAESRFHPRCGTSFLLITAIVVIFLFAVLDSLLIPIIGNYKSPLHRLLVHLPFIPLIAGLSYEVLKFSGKNSDNRILGLLIKPGLWLQHLTTREPGEAQLEVAAEAIKAALKNGGRTLKR